MKTPKGFVSSCSNAHTSFKNNDLNGTNNFPACNLLNVTLTLFEGTEVAGCDKGNNYCLYLSLCVVMVMSLDYSIDC